MGNFGAAFRLMANYLQVRLNLIVDFAQLAGVDGVTNAGRTALGISGRRYLWVFERTAIVIMALSAYNHGALPIDLHVFVNELDSLSRSAWLSPNSSSYRAQ